MFGFNISFFSNFGNVLLCKFIFCQFFKQRHAKCAISIGIAILFLSAVVIFHLKMFSLNNLTTFTISINNKLRIFKIIVFKYVPFDTTLFLFVFGHTRRVPIH